MPLEEIKLEIAPRELPAATVALLAAGDDLVRSYIERSGPQPAFGFVPSDYSEAYRCLDAIRRQGHACGRYFCEWGSGLGIVTCLASTLEFHASGIEIDAEMVDLAEQFARDRDLGVEFVAGTFIPTGGDEFTDLIHEFAWLQEGGADGYEDLGLDIDEFDVVYAYPWPGEEEVVESLFEHYAADGALLVTYHGREAMRVRRQVGRERRDRRDR